MTVAQVVLTLDQGGLEHLVIQLSAHLQRRGLRSLIVVLTDGVLVEAAKRQGLDVIVLGKREGFDPRLVFQLARLFRREHVDIVHSHNFAPLIYGAMAATLSGARTVNTRHGRAALRTHRFIWSLTHRVIAVCEDTRRQLLVHNRIAPGKVDVLLNAIDTAPYAARNPAATRAGTPLPAGVPVIGTVGRLSEEKDHETLLTAFRMLRDTGVEAHLAIVGGGPLQPALRARVSALGLDNCVHLLGFRTDVSALLPLFDVYVLPSKMEGVSLTLLEAMAAGLPVVATRVGGNPEVVIEGQTGLLVEASQPAALAAALTALLEHPDSSAAMGARGRARALEHFGIDRLVDAHVHLYERVLAD